MYDQMTYSYILERMLERVADGIDKREGSIIYDALAPAAAELSELYMQLDVGRQLSFADTASGEWLDRRTAEFGVNREQATYSLRQGEFYDGAGMPCDIPLASRFAIEDLRYAVVSKIRAGVYMLRCETAGVEGNQKFGAMLPLIYVNGLASAELTLVLVPGEDEEQDDALRERYYVSVREPAFGGNIADYKEMTNAIAGVGGTKVLPAWNGGGTVKCTIIASDWTEPAAQLITTVQTLVDPVMNSGEGLGIAPIGHSVTIASVKQVTISVQTTVLLASGFTVGQVQGDIEDAVHAYLSELRQDWANQTQLTVRIAQIDARLLNVSGVVDVVDTRLNGSAVNIVLAEDEIPASGTVIVYA